MTVSLEELFRDRFEVVADIIDAAPEQHEIYFTLPLIDKIGVGQSATAILKKVRSQRGFGLTVFFDDLRLVGMRNLTFDATKSPDAPGNRAFIEELKRRLDCEGLSLEEIVGHAGAGWKLKHRQKFQSALERRAY